MAELGKATQAELKAISAAFQVYGDFVSGCPYGSGHIKSTITSLPSRRPCSRTSCA